MITTQLHGKNLSGREKELLEQLEKLIEYYQLKSIKNKNSIFKHVWSVGFADGLNAAWKLILGDTSPLIEIEGCHPSKKK